MRASAAARRSTTATVASVEQSSATSISQSGTVCACTEATVSPMNAAAFQAGVMMETRGKDEHLGHQSARSRDPRLRAPNVNGP